MNVFIKFFLVIFSCTLFVAGAQDNGYNEKEGPFVRVTNHKDDTRTIFKRIPGQMQLQKRRYNKEGTRISVTVYYTDLYGEMRSCLIYDGLMNLLFKVQYVYDPNNGRLQMELMTDAKTNAMVSYFQYTYDSLGERCKNPVCVVFDKNATDKKYTPSALEKDPFAEDPKTKARGKTIK